MVVRWALVLGLFSIVLAPLGTADGAAVELQGSDRDDGSHCRSVVVGGSWEAAGPVCLTKDQMTIPGCDTPVCHGSPIDLGPYFRYEEQPVASAIAGAEGYESEYGEGYHAWASTEVRDGWICTEASTGLVDVEPACVVHVGPAAGHLPQGRFGVEGAGLLGGVQLADNDVVGALGLGDGDHDGIPDVLEGEACGRAVLQSEIDGEAIPGQCNGTSDYDAAFLDHDNDGVPDALDAMLCQLEDRNDPSDGSCVGDDYTSPVPH